MKIFILVLLLSLSSCQFFGGGEESWTEDTVEMLLRMTKRKSMIHDTPLKIMEELELPNSDIKLSKQKLCRCAASLYGGMLTVIANDVRDSKVEYMCKGMGSCFYNLKPPKTFKKTCAKYVQAGPFKRLAKSRSESIPRLSKTRRQLSLHCSKL